MGFSWAPMTSVLLVVGLMLLHGAAGQGPPKGRRGPGGPPRGPPPCRITNVTVGEVLCDSSVNCTGSADNCANCRNITRDGDILENCYCEPQDDTSMCHHPKPPPRRDQGTLNSERTGDAGSHPARGPRGRRLQPEGRQRQS